MVSKFRKAAVAKGEGKEAAAGCKLRLVGCRMAAGGMEGPSRGGCRQMGTSFGARSVLPELQLWQLGCSQQNKVCSRLEAKKTLQRPKNFLYAWLIFKRELTCVV